MQVARKHHHMNSFDLLHPLDWAGLPKGCPAADMGPGAGNGAGVGHGSGYGPGDGTGNQGEGPEDGTGYGAAVEH